MGEVAGEAQVESRLLDPGLRSLRQGAGTLACLRDTLACAVTTPAWARTTFPLAATTAALLARLFWTASSSSCWLTEPSWARGVAVHVERGPALIGLGPGHVGLSLADQGVGLVHPRFGLFDLGPGLQNLGFRLLELGPRLVEGGLIGTGIDLEQQISLADEGAFLVVLAHEVAGHQRANLGVDVAGRGADPFAVNRHVTLNDGGHVDLQRRG